MIPKPKYPIATLHEEGRPPLIGTDLRNMGAAIQRNHEPMGQTTEIDDVRTNRVLSTKLGLMELPIAQVPPEDALTVGLPPAKPSRTPRPPAPLTLTLSPLGGEGALTLLLHRVFLQKDRKISPIVSKLVCS
jgi:hypothetical protein